MQYIGFITSIGKNVIVFITINQIFQIISFCIAQEDWLYSFLLNLILYELLWKIPQIPIYTQQSTAFSLVKWKYLQGSQRNPV